MTAQDPYQYPTGPMRAQFPPPPPVYMPPPWAPAQICPSATTSLVFGIVGFFGGFFLIIPPFAAVICGHVALRQIKRTGMGGSNRAFWGLALGYLVLAGFAVILVTAIAGAIAGH